MMKFRAAPGFSLVELLVVLAIFVIVSSVILANHSQFGSKVVLENMAYDMALSIRHAQLYGIAVRRFGTGTSNFSVAYGMHFASPTTYQMFADALNGDGQYQCPNPQNPATCELVESTTIVGGQQVSSLCVRPTGSQTYVCGKTSLDIVFRRPESDAFIRASTGGVPDGVLYETAQIILTSPRGESRAIVVEQTGQISVQAI